MCGICGLLRYDENSADPACVMQAAHLMRHRGPGGEGYLLLNTATGQHSLRNGPDTPSNISYPMVDAPCSFVPDLVLGHRRLAIIDLSPGGHEPMTIQDGHLWVTYNGEIYNYVEIRDELVAKGYEFQSESDVEVLLQAYEEWDLDCLDRFIGMFAFALWDQKQRRLWCVRDRMGVKPFYYAADPNYFAFASEIKALKVLAPAAYQPDESQLAWFLHYGQVYNAPNTFFKGVRELPAAHYIVVENGKVSEPVRWWNVDLQRAHDTYDYSNMESEFLRLMQHSVKLRLRSDVPVGTCLSGGLDSSTIVALATQQLDGGRMNSFSAVYPVRGMDETRFVDIVSDHYKTIKHTITPSPDQFLDRLQRITWHQDIPTGTSGVYTQNFVMDLAHGKVTVLLDGQGADELFAGYLSYVVHYLTDLRRRSPMRWVGEQISFMLGVWPRFNAALNLSEFATRVYHYLRLGRQPLNLLSPEFRMLAEAREEMRLTPLLQGGDSLNKHLYQSLTRDSIPALLHYEDRNSMAYSIEARVPFLDHRMVEFALGIPAEKKIRGPETKVIMRKALKNVLPGEIAERKDKLGYPTPLGQWLRGSLREPVNTYLHDTVFKRPWYNVERLKELWQQHQNEQRNAEQVIYRAITAEQWYQNVTTSGA